MAARCVDQLDWCAMVPLLVSEACVHPLLSLEAPWDDLSCGLGSGRSVSRQPLGASAQLPLLVHSAGNNLGVLPPEGHPPGGTLRVVWPPERLPRNLPVNGKAYAWRPSARFRFEGTVRFGSGVPVSRLDGPVELEGVPGGWRMTWHARPEAWVAAAAEGELGSTAPFEAKRALAAVLKVWVQGHPQGHHPDGSFCPLTHCAVIRGMPTAEGRLAAAQAPELAIGMHRAFFTGSKGGISLSPREVWGTGSAVAGGAQVIPGDPWATWSRVLTADQVRALKGAVRPGLKPGQQGLTLGPSGPYAVENLRIEAGRRWGWNTWPSNACTAESQGDGSVLLRGKGWGHNAGLCLATAIHRARQGDRAERILEEAFPEENPDREK